MDLMKAIEAYVEKFEEGPPVFGMEEDDAIAQIKKAIETNKKIEDGAEVDAPEDVLI